MSAKPNIKPDVKAAIIADALLGDDYPRIAERHGVARDTVKKIVWRFRKATGVGIDVVQMIEPEKIEVKQQPTTTAWMFASIHEWQTIGGRRGIGWNNRCAVNVRNGDRPAAVGRGRKSNNECGKEPHHD